MRALLILLALTAARPAFPAIELSAQLGLVPWKAAGRIDNLAARAAFERFLALNPNVRVVEFERLWLPGHYWGAAEVMSIAGNAGPEIMLVPFSELGGYVRAGLIQDLESQYEGWSGKIRFPESLRQSLKLEGKSWGAIHEADYAMLAGNREVLAAQGMDDGTMPATWDQLLEAAARLKVPGKRCGLALQTGKPLAYLWLALARQAGGAYVVKVGAEGIEADLLGTPSLRAAKFLSQVGKRLRAAGPDSLMLAEDDEKLRQAFVEGRTVFALISSRDMDVELFDPGTRGKGLFALQPVKPCLAPVPGAFSPEPVAYSVGGHCAVISSHVRNSLRRDLIWNFYIAATRVSNNVDRSWLDLAMERKELVASSFIMRYPEHPAVRYLPQAWSHAFRASTADAAAMPPDSEFERLAEMLAPRLAEVIWEGSDPEKAMAQVQYEFENTMHNKFRKDSIKWAAVGWAILAIMVGILVFGLVKLVATLRDEMRQFGKGPAESMTPIRILSAFVLFIPALGLAIVFGIVPLLNGLRMSFFANVLRDGGTFVALKNYINVAIDPNTHLAVSNTLYYLVLSFLMAFLAPLILALVLSNFPRGKFLIRSAFFLPAVASAVVVAIVWQQMYDLGGPFNDMATLLGFASRNWLEDPAVAMFGVVLAQSWCTLGVSGLTYLAGLTTVPEEYYEDAEIMGAGLMDRFQHVTIPHIWPLIGINFVGWLVATTRTAEHVFLMTGGGPDRTTHVIGLEIFNQAFVNIRFGYAMAEVWLLVAIVLIFSIYQMRAIRSGQLKVRSY